MYTAPDNRLFKVNGNGSDLLLKTLKLALETSGFKQIDSYRIDPIKGFVLQWHCEKEKSIELKEKTPEEVLPLIEEYLETDEADLTEKKRWESAFDDDGYVIDDPGWVVYCEDWGHIGADHYAIVAIKKVYMWYGK